MEEKWQKFETSCFEYLVKQYGGYANFQAYGQSNSTIPDVLVIPANAPKFYIETKSPNAQCGQFVLIADENKGKFNYSSRNKTPFLPETELIIDFMNNNFKNFVFSGTKGTPITLNKAIFYSWIKSYYSSKNVQFFITKGNDYIIFPIKNFEQYFDVTATYRIKKSGSSTPSISNIPEIETILQKNHIKGYIINLDNKFYLKTQDNIGNKKLTGNKYTYLFKEQSNSLFLIRKLSNTSNYNVIFQIDLKEKKQNPQHLKDFLHKIDFVIK